MRTRDTEVDGRREYLNERGWMWKWKRVEEAPKAQPRKLFTDDSFQFMRPRITIER